MTTTIEHVVNTEPPPSVDDADAAPSATRQTRAWRADDYAVLIGSLLAAATLMWLLFFVLTPLQSVAGWAFCSYVAFLALYGYVERQLHDRLAARDRVMAVLIASAGLATIVPLVMILVTVVIKGWETFRVAFFFETMQGVGPLTPSDQGGALHAIVGTLEQVGLAVLLAVPLGICCAVFLNEIGGRFAQPVRTIVNAMSGVPSIVAGLFIYAIWIRQLGNYFSGWAAAMALAVLMLPSVTRAAEEVLRLVPGGLREASLALGSSEWRSTWNVVLPTARTGLITAAILGMARALGETAPLLLTSLGDSVTDMTANPFAGPQSSLPVFVWTLYQSPQSVQQARAWTGALVLVIVVLALFVIARWMGNRKPGTRSLLKRVLRRY